MNYSLVARDVEHDIVPFGLDPNNYRIPDGIRTQIKGEVRIMRDSAAATTLRLQRFQGEVREDLYGLGQQLIQIQTLTGASEQRLRQFRLDMEQRSREIQAANAADTGARAAAAGLPVVATGLPEIRRCVPST